MAATKSRCRFCNTADTVAIVKTPNGFTHVCADHVDHVLNPVSINWLEPTVAMSWKTANEMTGAEFRRLGIPINQEKPPERG